jgi:hypothetical protein
MKNSILNLEGVKVLSKNDQKNINGGFKTWCARRSLNVDDTRPGSTGNADTAAGYQSVSGCWIYPGMSPYSTIDCPPGSICYHGAN